MQLTLGMKLSIKMKLKLILEVGEHEICDAQLPIRVREPPLGVLEANLVDLDGGGGARLCGGGAIPGLLVACHHSMELLKKKRAPR